MEFATRLRRATNRARFGMPDRYGHLEREIAKNKCRRILEIGVWDGEHSRRMIQAGLRYSDPTSIEYFGIDLFEDAYEIEDILDREASKRPPPLSEVKAKLQDLEEIGVGINLVKGDSKEILPALAVQKLAMDFVFVDGGHSYETVSSDWRNVQRMIGGRSVVIFDDYVNREAVEARGYGVNVVVDAIDRGEFAVSLLDPVDRFRHSWGILMTRFVKVQMTRTLQAASEIGGARG